MFVFFWYHFSSAWRAFCTISFKASLDFFLVFLHWECLFVFIPWRIFSLAIKLGSGLMILILFSSFLPSFLYLFIFNVLCLLARTASDEKFTVIWVVVPYINVSLLSTSDVLPFIFCFQQCDCEVSRHGFLWVYPVWDLLGYLKCKSMSFAKFGEFSAIIATLFWAWHTFFSFQDERQEC